MLNKCAVLGDYKPASSGCKYHLQDGNTCTASETILCEHKILSGPIEAELTIADYQEVIDSHKAVVRQIDQIINGENAAPQASLCDLVGQIQELVNSNKTTDINLLAQAFKEINFEQAVMYEDMLEQSTWMARQRIDTLEFALMAIIDHHIRHNNLDHNDQERSVTLRIARSAIGHAAPVPPQPDSADAQDAARYRWLRRGQRYSVVNGIGDDLRAEAIDAAVDADIAHINSSNEAKP